MANKAVVIGGGPLGLSAVNTLLERGYEVSLFEAGSRLGGLAAPVPFGDIEIDQFYHFFYWNDHQASVAFLRRIGVEPKIHWEDIRTDTFADAHFVNFDSVPSVLGLARVHAMRSLVTLLKLRLKSPDAELDTVAAFRWAEQNFGPAFAKTVWCPLLEGKFGSQSKTISALWLATRVRRHMSTKVGISNRCRFGYLESTYAPAIERIRSRLLERGGLIHQSAAVSDLIVSKGCVRGLKVANQSDVILDEGTKVFSTIPLFALKRLPTVAAACSSLAQFEGVGAIVVVLRLARRLSGAYWTTVVDAQVPFNAVIQQNRLFPKCEDEIVYLSRYVAQDDPSFGETHQSILDRYLLGLSKVFPDFRRSDVLDFQIARARSAAPVPQVGTAASLPPFRSPIHDFFHAGFEHIYPEDRGVGNSLVVGDRLVHEALQ